MSERPESARMVARFVVALMVLGGGFGGGAVFGWATRKPAPNLPKHDAESIPETQVKTELAACKRELKDLKKAQAKSSALRMVDDAGLEHAAKVEALQKEVHECQVRETLQNAYVCATIGDHATLYMVLVHGAGCADPPGIGDYMVNSVDKCAEFAELHEDPAQLYPAHLDEDELTEQQRLRFFESKYRWRVTKESKVWGLEQTRRACRRIWALPEPWGDESTTSFPTLFGRVRRIQGPNEQGRN